MTIPYQAPDSWIKYDPNRLMGPLTGAKAAVLSLTGIPYQRSWAEKLQVVQLKREVAGTSRIEGADFTEGELDAALAESPAELHTRSQRQATAALRAYRWIAQLPEDHPLDRETILNIHRLIVTGPDDDHCPPGQIRSSDQNVTFGSPRHRGVEGGRPCEQAFSRFAESLEQEMTEHDPLLRALAAHYHFASMHPFLDGIGRTARALETLLLQRCGLRDTLFIAMSNYYYEEKETYLRTLAEVRANDHDLTAFLAFGLRGVEIQCRRLFEQISTQLAKAVYRNVMFDMFQRPKTARKRVIAKRQIKILTLLLERSMSLEELANSTEALYGTLKNPDRALSRDLYELIWLNAIEAKLAADGEYELFVRLAWAMEITEAEFLRQVKSMPRAKTHGFLNR
jgi:Fic family protein